MKDEVGDLYVSRSGTLVRGMLEDALLYELHIFLYPLTRGEGPKLFAEGASPKKMSRASSEAFENGVVYLNYRK